MIAAASSSCFFCVFVLSSATLDYTYFHIAYIMKRDATMRISENQSYASLLLAQKAREPTLSSYAGMSPTSFNLPINLSIPVA